MTEIHTKTLDEFQLPSEILDLVSARNKLRETYAGMGLSFTFDGKLVGDIGEALAVRLFGIVLTNNNSAGIDGHTKDGAKTVQIKATGTKRGPAFRPTDAEADHLLFFDLDFENARGAVIFNGPETIARGYLPDSFGLEDKNQRMITANKIRKANSKVVLRHRLPMLSELTSKHTR